MQKQLFIIAFNKKLQTTPAAVAVCGLAKKLLSDVYRACCVLCENGTDKWTRPCTYSYCANIALPLEGVTALLNGTYAPRAVMVALVTIQIKHSRLWPFHEHKLWLLVRNISQQCAVSVREAVLVRCILHWTSVYVGVFLTWLLNTWTPALRWWAVVFLK